VNNIIHQLKTDGSPLDGMSYIFQGDDGRIAVLDGGMKNDVDYLLQYLKRITGLDKPKVDLWMISHAHADHTFAFIYMAQWHGDELTVERVMYDFPDASFFEKKQPQVVPELKLFEDAVDIFQAERVKPYAGMELFIGSMAFEVLFTASDLPKIEEAGLEQCTNDTSLVFRVKYKGQKILFLGDVQRAANRVMIDRYGEDLKADVVQVAHHGEYSTTEEFYRLVDPRILLWPVNKLRSEQLVLAKMNRFLFYKTQLEDIIISGEGTRAIELPIKPSVAPNTYIIPIRRSEAERVVNIPYSEREIDVERCPEDFFDADEEKTMEYVFNRDASQNASFRALYREDALYLEIKLYNKSFVLDETKTSTQVCDNARIYFSEKVYDSFEILWEDVDCRAFTDMKIYPHKKLINGRPVYSSRDDICQSNAYSFDGGVRLVVKIPFAAPKKKNDTLSLGFEVNLIESSSCLRGSWMLYPSVSAGFRMMISPAGLQIFRLN